MNRSKRLSLWLSLVLGLLLLTAAFWARPALADPLSPSAATRIVPEFYAAWAQGQGLLHYWTRCVSADPIPPDWTGYLKRLPSGGGPITTIATTSIAALDCNNFYGMGIAPEGIYYWNANPTGSSRMEFRASADPSTVVPIVNTTAKPFAEIVISGDYIYWASSDANQILRTLKAGGGAVELVASASAPTDVLVFGTNIYWLDQTGLWFTSVACGTLPCDGNKSQKASFNVSPHQTFSLVYRSNRFSDSFFWVFDGPVDQIYRWSCNTITIQCDPVLVTASNKLYEVPSDTYRLGELAVSGSRMFWTESFYLDPNLDGRVRRMTFPNLGAPVTEDIVVNAPGIDYLIAANGNDVFYSIFGAPQSGGGIYRVEADAAAIVRDLSASAMEVTQALQNLANDVPLTAEKTTWVRAYPQLITGPNANSVEARLVGLRNGQPLPGSPLQSLNGSRSLVAGGNFDRAFMNSGYLFRLPSSWTTNGLVTVRLEVNYRGNYVDPNPGNDMLSRTVNFQKKAPVCAVYVPVRTAAGNDSVDNPNFPYAVNLAEKLWPAAQYWTYYQDTDVAELEVCYGWLGVPYPCFGPYELTGNNWKVFGSLYARSAITDEPDECQDNNAETIFMGMVHNRANIDGKGPGNGPSGTAILDSYVGWFRMPPRWEDPQVSAVWPDQGTTLAHELAHNAGREHVDCGGPADPDPNYPGPDNQLDEIGNENHYGLHGPTLRIFTPANGRDLLSYCRPRWVSAYTYKALYNWLDNNSVAAAEETVTAANPLAGAAGVVIASGSVGAGAGETTLNYAYTLPSNAVSAGVLNKLGQSEAHLQAQQAQAAGEDATVYALRLVGENNQPVAELPITPLEADTSGAPQPEIFFTTFAAPAQRIIRVELLAGGQISRTLRLGPSVPQVTVTSPSAGLTISGTLSIGWTATDLDNDLMQFMIQYSPDNGASWHTLVSDYAQPAGQNTFAFQVGATGYPGSAPNQARLRVIASDGANTGIGVSGAFSVSNRPPRANITSPLAGTTLQPTALVQLAGSAMDAEDGRILGGALTWKLNGAPVGGGSEILLAGLKPGAYAVGLTAADSGVAAADAQAVEANPIQFNIAPLALNETNAPTMDGACDDFGYLAAPQLPLKTYPSTEHGTVRLTRASGALWACFTGLQPAESPTVSFVGVRVDVNLSGETLAQSSDVAFFVREDGLVASAVGNGGGGFAVPGPAGLQGQVRQAAGQWSAELRIPAAAIGGLDHAVGLTAGHYGLAGNQPTFAWPFAAGDAAPNTWAETVLGALPFLVASNPYTATQGGPDLLLHLSGENFAVGAVARLGENDLTTQVGDSVTLTATVPTGLLNAAGEFPLTVRNPGGFTSNAVSFTIIRPGPVLTSLTPPAVEAGRGSFVLQITGANFAAGAVVYMDGRTLPATVVSPTSIQAQVSAARVETGRISSIAVVNADPSAGVSDTLNFTIVAPEQKTFLPMVDR